MRKTVQGSVQCADRRADHRPNGRFAFTRSAPRGSVTPIGDLRSNFDLSHRPFWDGIVGYLTFQFQGFR
jgi:hypothetical protein